MKKHVKFQSGEKYNRLVLVSLHTRKVGSNLWLCKCDCGKEIITSPRDVRSGHTRSCGCLKIEQMRQQFRTHGLTETREYRIWCHMKRRCTSPTSPKYSYYGGRGIKICERWVEFKNFLADMGKCPQYYSLDRIDNNGNYEPSNCRWASDKTQSHNKRNIKRVVLFGIEMPRIEAERELHIGSGSISQRAFDRKQSLQEACDYFAKKYPRAQDWAKCSDCLIGIMGFAA